MTTTRKCLLVLACSLACSSGLAATLAADSLLCEGEAEVQFIASEQYIPDKHGSKALAGAKNYVDFYALKQQAAPLMSSARVADRDMARAKSESEVYARVVRSCASSGTTPIAAVEVLERRPISGSARVKLRFGGQDVTLWTFSSALSD